MAEIIAKNISVTYPIFGTDAKSIKKTALAALTGGIISEDRSNHIVEIHALKNLSFSWNDGDRIGLVGHNGSGKSTLLRTLLGAYTPTKGHLKVHGKISSMISISSGLENEATGLENIYLRGKLLNLNKFQIKRMTDDIISFAGLGDFIKMPIRTYSSGMMMRLAFGLATSMESDIILMDEWLSVGDADFSKKSQERLKNMVEKAKILVLASHDSKLVDETCNKVYHMCKGEFISSE